MYYFARDNYHSRNTLNLSSISDWRQTANLNFLRKLRRMRLIFLHRFPVLILQFPLEQTTTLIFLFKFSLLRSNTYFTLFFNTFHVTHKIRGPPFFVIIFFISMLYCLVFIFYFSVGLL